jgi:hypothetical protein
MSYDIDGDGVVGSHDLFLARRFDLTGKGKLEGEEKTAA